MGTYFYGFGAIGYPGCQKNVGRVFKLLASFFYLVFEGFFECTIEMHGPLL